MKTLSLNTGVKLPTTDLGLWKIPGADTSRVVKEAITMGYRHFDSACDYGNEAEAGEGIADAISDKLCQREDLWITSKLWNTYHRRDHVRPALERTLKDLRLDYLDLYLIHFPIAQKFVPFEKRYPPEWLFDPDAEHPEIQLDKVPIHETWSAMEELVKAGLVRNLGICNFGTALLQDLINCSQIQPSVLQIERHPYLVQEKLVRFCKQVNVAVTGFSPLGAGSYLELGMAEPADSVLKEPIVKTIAENHGKTAAQVALRWGIQQGTSVIPKSVNPDRLRENLDVYDFELTLGEIHSISALDRNHRFNDPGVFAETTFNTFCPIYE